MPDLHLNGTVVGHNYLMDGKGTVGIVDIYATPTTQEFPLGTRIVREDGAVFRYTQAAGAMNRGVVASADVSAVGLVDTDAIFAAAGSGFNSTDDNVVRISSTDVSGIAVDIWAGGTLHITDDDGEGYAYHIRSNTVTASNVTDVTLFENLQAALTTDSDGAVTGLQWRESVIANNGSDEVPNGICVATFADNDFGWLQTWGIGTVLCDGVCLAGAPATLSDGVNGAAQDLGGGGTDAADLVSEAFLGVFTVDGDDTGHTGISIQLHP